MKAKAVMDTIDLFDLGADYAEPAPVEPSGPSTGMAVHWLLRCLCPCGRSFAAGRHEPAAYRNENTNLFQPEKLK